MKGLFERDLDDVPLSAFTARERSALGTAYFLHLTAQCLGLRVVEPALEAWAQAELGYGGMEVKHLETGEREVYSLAQEVRREADDGSGDQVSEWLYVGTLLVTGEAADGRLIYRSAWGRDRVFERLYRELRYGSLLAEGQDLPVEHLLSFEGVPELSGLAVGTSG